MLYLAIDQHRKQLTVNLRDESGEILVRRQVSTRWDRVREFFEWLQTKSDEQGGRYATVGYDPLAHAHASPAVRLRRTSGGETCSSPVSTRTVVNQPQIGLDRRGSSLPPSPSLRPQETRGEGRSDGEGGRDSRNPPWINKHPFSRNENRQ